MNPLRRARPAAFVAFLLLPSHPGFAAEPPLRALRWLAPQAARVVALTRAPPECLAATSPAIEIGRAAFRSPLLLGGQAARAGLACDSCHRSGRGNPDFHFPGISGAPGTADVTASLFSSKRGDDTHNPKPIPDLALAPRTVPSQNLRAFIEGLITEEFDGAPPSTAVLDGLVAYVAALDPKACPPGDVPITPAAVAADARRAVAAARAAHAAGDAKTAATMLLAARAQLGTLAERYAALPSQRAQLLSADAALAAALTAVRGNTPGAIATLAKWEAATPAWTKGLRATQARSLFDPGRLAALLSSSSVQVAANPVSPATVPNPAALPAESRQPRQPHSTLDKRRQIGYMSRNDQAPETQSHD